jgi:hypothetical protein
VDGAVVKFYCCTCRQKLSAEAQDAGRTIQCPVCQTCMRVPRVSAAAAPAAPVAVGVPAPPVASPAASEPTPPRAIATPARRRPVLARAWYGGGIGLLAVVALGGVLSHFMFRPVPPPVEPTLLPLPPELQARTSDAPTRKEDEGRSPILPPAESVAAITLRARAPAAEVRSQRVAGERAAVGPSNTAPASTGVHPRPGESGLSAAKTAVVLTVGMRQKIFAELMEADAAATKAADARFPAVLSGPDTQAGQRRDFQEKQLQELRRAIREKHGLTRDQVDTIFAEGVEERQSGVMSATGAY